MSISPAQMILQVENSVSPVSTRPSAPASVAAKAVAAISPVESPTLVAAAASPTQFSTDRQIDDHHQVYYEIVDDNTGKVLMELPPEALRKIGESLNLPL